MTSIKHHQHNNENKQDPNYPKITDYYCIPLCLKRRLNTNAKIHIINDYKLINPNIHALFNQYNHLFFDDKLSTVRVKWDYSEKYNAGLCQNISNFCVISLSVQLLQYRSTKDLIETLVHEMIHSYLFIKQIHHKEKSHHGARFLSIMNVINYVCNTSKLNIWVRHDYLSEIQAQKSHKWQCNVCKQIIFRPYCRPPGKHEKWWNKHQLECGGTYDIVQLNKNKKNLTSEEWEKKKLLKKQEKERQRQMKKEQRDKQIGLNKNKKKINKRDKRKKYKNVNE